MPRLIFFLIIAIPLIELWLLIEVGSEIGGLNCVLLVLATAMVGGFIARRQGFDLFRRIRARAAMGKPVVDETIDAFAVLFAGLMLLFPGLMTDVLGFLLLWPRFRKFLRGGLFNAVYARRDRSNFPHGRDQSEDFFVKSPPSTGESTNKIIDIDTTKQ